MKPKIKIIETWKISSSLFGWMKHTHKTPLCEELLSTCLGEEFEAKGQTGQLQSSTESEAKLTARVACIVETSRLQNPKERFDNNFLINTNAIDHEITPSTTTFLIWSSIFLFVLAIQIHRTFPKWEEPNSIAQHLFILKLIYSHCWFFNFLVKVGHPCYDRIRK